MLPGATDLLLLGEGMLDFLPPGASAQLLGQVGETQFYVVPLDPQAPLVLEEDGHISMLAKEGAGPQWDH